MFPAQSCLLLHIPRETGNADGACGWHAALGLYFLLINIPKRRSWAMLDYLLLCALVLANYSFHEAPSIAQWLRGAGLISGQVCWKNPGVLATLFLEWLVGRACLLHQASFLQLPGTHPCTVLG